MLNKVERAKEFKLFSGVGGRYFFKAIRTGLAGSVGARAENAALPTAGNYSYAAVQIKEAFHYGTIQLSGPVMNNSRGDKNAFAEALKMTMDSMFDEFRLVANIYLHGWGAGIVGEVLSMSTDTATLKDDVLPISWLYPNQLIDGGASDSSASPNHDTGLIVKTVDKVLKKVQFTTTPSTLAANDYLFIAGSAQVAPLGLFAAVDDGTYVTTYVNISRTTTPDFKSYVDAQGGSATKYGNATRRTITPNLLQVALDEQQLRAGVQRPVDLLYSSLKVRRVFWQGLAPDRRYDSGTYDGGWKAIKFSNGDVEMPWVASEFAPRYTIFGLYTGTTAQPQGHKADKIQDEEVLALYESPWGSADWDAETGSNLKQVYSSGAFVDAVGAFLKWLTQTGHGPLNPVICVNLLDDRSYETRGYLRSVTN